MKYNELNTIKNLINAIENNTENPEGFHGKSPTLKLQYISKEIEEIKDLIKRYNNKFDQCPRCNQTLNPIPFFNATSRADHTTKICNDCGTWENMYNMNYPGKKLPPFLTK